MPACPPRIVLLLVIHARKLFGIWFTNQVKYGGLHEKLSIVVSAFHTLDVSSFPWKQMFWKMIIDQSCFETYLVWIMGRRRRSVVSDRPSMIRSQGKSRSFGWIEILMALSVIKLSIMIRISGQIEWVGIANRTWWYPIGYVAHDLSDGMSIIWSSLDTIRLNLLIQSFSVCAWKSIRNQRFIWKLEYLRNRENLDRSSLPP